MQIFTAIGSPRPAWNEWMGNNKLMSGVIIMFSAFVNWCPCCALHTHFVTCVTHSQSRAHLREACAGTHTFATCRCLRELTRVLIPHTPPPHTHPSSWEPGPNAANHWGI